MTPKSKQTKRNAKKLTPAERKRRAELAAAARWGRPAPESEPNDKVYRDIEPKIAIKSVTTEMIANKGIDTLTMKEIADAAGVGLPTVYRFFPTKADLIRACRVELVKKSLEVVDANIELNKTPETKLYALVAVLSQGLFHRDPERHAYLALRDPMAGVVDPAVGPLVKPYWERYAELAEQIGVPDPKARVFSIYALMAGFHRYTSIRDAIPMVAETVNTPEGVAEFVLSLTIPGKNWPAIRNLTKLKKPSTPPSPFEARMPHLHCGDGSPTPRG